MFNGYYMKIDGAIYPTRLMVISSYAPVDTPIIVKSFRDAAYGNHVVFAPKKDLSIKFKIRSLYNDEFPEAISPIKNGEVMTVEFFDTKTNEYKTDTFVCKSNLVPTIHRQYNDKVLYNELSVELERVAT